MLYTNLRCLGLSRRFKVTVSAHIGRYTLRVGTVISIILILEPLAMLVEAEDDADNEYRDRGHAPIEADEVLLLLQR